MKIRKIFGIFTAVLFASCLFLAACNGTKVTVDSISITKDPTKTVYYIGETFSPEGGELTAKLSDGNERVVPLTDDEVELSEVKTATAGRKTVTVTYSGKRARFEVTVSIQTFTVAFDLNYEDAPVPETKIINKDDTVNEPNEPKRDSYNVRLRSLCSCSAPKESSRTTDTRNTP